MNELGPSPKSESLTIQTLENGMFDQIDMKHDLRMLVSFSSTHDGK